MKQFIKRAKDYWESVKTGEKKMQKDVMLIIALSGILLYVIVLPTSNNSSYQKEKKASDSENTYLEEQKQQLLSNENYQEELEQRLEQFLTQLEGVGEVKVLIYMGESQEYIVEKDKKTEETQDNEAKDSTKRLEQTYLEETIYTVNADGDEVPFVSKTKTPVITGVAIAAQGAANEQVRVSIIRMVMALYDLEANQVEVYILKNN